MSSSHAAMQSAAGHAEIHEEHGSAHVHVVPLGFLALIGAILMVLTVATVGATYIDLGYTGNLALCLAIAVVKAALVLLYFMHLRWDNAFNAVCAIGALLFIAIMIVACIQDTGQYMPNLHAPGASSNLPK
jgi:cytochrome c oxidase subunit IV